MASTSRVCEVVPASIPTEPHQPKELDFPKRSFGKKNAVSRSFQPEWFKKWPFLHYDEANDTVFCHVCLIAVKTKRMRTGYIDPAFVSSFS